MLILWIIIECCRYLYPVKGKYINNVTDKVIMKTGYFWSKFWSFGIIGVIKYIIGNLWFEKHLADVY